ncbi:MAG: N-acetylmuramoyl-L-alanine amidase [Nitrospinota bacterium]|nr:N-acetylmuramoyl-L-alanine amidase [Nitrospinota bacterium]MDH5757125.1 N-acetylmuramoyl-L-alanine amidase [Nitrospinota bacterium]
MNSDKLIESINNTIPGALFDGRGALAVNTKVAKWKKRDPNKIIGMCWHQELGWGSVEAVARYHTSDKSHLREGGVESISYTFAIRRDGQIVLCNDLEKKPWSQGYANRPGDENAEFISVMFEGFFNGPGVTDSTAGEPTHNQIAAGMALWGVCRDEWKWDADALYGHYHFGKPACPGATLGAVIEATRAGVKKKTRFPGARQRQKALLQLGYYKNKVDGKWGPISRSALIAFQKDAGLHMDGIWGPMTERAILRRLADL